MVREIIASVIKENTCMGGESVSLTRITTKISFAYTIQEL
jgi:hypothetical protein